MSFTIMPVQAEIRKTNRPYLYLATLQLLDVLTTGYILHYWALRAEGNPIAALILSEFGLSIGLTILLAFKLFTVWMFWICQTKVRIAKAIYSLVILNNLLFIVAWWVTL